MHVVLRPLGIRQHIAEQISSFWHKVAMRRARMLPEKYGMVELMLELKEAEIRAEVIAVHTHQGHTEIIFARVRDGIQQYQ